MTTLRSGIVLVSLVMASACATSVPQTGVVTITPKSAVAAEGEWAAAVAAATRRHEPYAYTMRLADLRATLVTPRLRQAFGRERARFHGRFAKDAAKDLLQLGTVDEGVDAAKVIARPESEEQILVFVAFYAADQKNRDLAIKGSIWDTALRRGQTVVRPIALEAVRFSPAVTELFPFVDRFDDLYLARFPAVDPASGAALLMPGDEPLHLQVASAVADCDVSWTLVGDPQQD